MADYYPLVAKAVAGLEKNTGEVRRMLYERARTALVAQLRGMNDPPLTEAEITRERLALEEAIRTVEAEAARRVPAPTPSGGRAPDPRAWTGRPGPARPVEPRPGPQRQSPMRQTSADDIGELPKHSRAGLIAAIVTVLLILTLGAAAYWQRDRIASLVARVRAPASTQPTDATAVKPKITDRVGQPPAQSDSQTTTTQNAGPVAAVAQRVVLYEEDPADPQGKRYVGSAIWRTETVTPGPGAA